jgi:hypothetical protein
MSSSGGGAYMSSPKEKSLSKSKSSLSAQHTAMLNNIASSRLNKNLRESLGNSSVHELRDTLRNRALTIFKTQDKKLEKDYPGKLSRKQVSNLSHSLANKKYKHDR